MGIELRLSVLKVRMLTTRPQPPLHVHNIFFENFVKKNRLEMHFKFEKCFGNKNKIEIFIVVVKLFIIVAASRPLPLNMKSISYTKTLQM